MIIKHFLVWQLILWAAVCILPAQLPPKKIPQSELGKSLKKVLQGKVALQWKGYEITGKEKKDLAGKLKLKRSLPDTVYVGVIKNTEEELHVLVDEAPSKTEKFVFALYIDQSGIVDVDILIYREQYGNEIDLPLFKRQFKGIKEPNQLIFGRTVQGITGATISARSLTYATKDLLVIYQIIKDKFTL
jgi:hypothetical protein